MGSQLRRAALGLQDKELSSRPGHLKLAPGVARRGRPGPSGLLALQHKAGNRATTALLAAGQAKLVVSAASDRYEREADSVAAEVLARLRLGRTAEGQVGAPAPAPLAAGRAAEGFSWPVGGALSRRPSDGPMGPQGGELDGGTEAVVSAARSSGGAPLPGGLRGQMEGAFGADFSKVKLHTGSEAQALNHRVGALAFTVGSDIFLGRAAPELSTPAGQSLLAHELAHTIQQGAAKLVGAGQDARRWAVQRKFTDQANLATHYQKHVKAQGEFPELKTMQEYDDLSTSLWAARGASGCLSKNAASGNRVYVYDPSTNNFGVFTPDGKAITLFRPKNGLNYYNKQV